MATPVLSIFARGRIAWILSIVLGTVLLLVGVLAHAQMALIAGGAFLLFGVVMLVVSLATGGRVD